MIYDLFAGTLAAVGVRGLPGKPLAGKSGGRVTGGATASLTDVARIEKHLASLKDNGLTPPNLAMLERLRQAAREGRPLTVGEQYFVKHELTEARLMERGVPEPVAHSLAMKTHPTYANYDPAVIKQFPQYFNQNWFSYWGIG